MQEISTHLPGILLAYSAFLVAVASPGPNILAVIGTSMGVSRESGMALAAGVATGSFTWALLTVFGLSAILAAYASALFAIKIFGGLYLLWLAYKAFKSASSRHDIEAKELAGGRRTALGYFKRGYLIQMTNPKAALAWIAIISLGLKAGAPYWVAASIVLGTFALSISIHLIYAVAFSTPFMMRHYSNARRLIQGVLGTFFAFAGLRLLLSRN
ncbi:LysE family translocator [Rhodospirillaceae bacterium KN72]|uniref:LysE family translocator n=1 Tax=Pacificispira spongiicola TaxID=2729598 RepID=A0A7Y0HF79_9PROT|nr:LysE family translocator [Pacificispira spongiicola]NMM44288.1 LysE family translocator [Pacificispira spongiicola]